MTCYCLLQPAAAGHSLLQPKASKEGFWFVCLELILGVSLLGLLGHLLSSLISGVIVHLRQ